MARRKIKKTLDIHSDRVNYEIITATKETPPGENGYIVLNLEGIDLEGVDKVRVEKFTLDSAAAKFTSDVYNFTGSPEVPDSKALKVGADSLRFGISEIYGKSVFMLEINLLKGLGKKNKIKINAGDVKRLSEKFAVEMANEYWRQVNTPNTTPTVPMMSPQQKAPKL